MDCLHHPAERLTEFFRRQTIARLPELQAALGTTGERTVFRRLAELLGLDATTVARGRRQLLTGEVLRERIRREGGGRKPVEKKRPT